MKKLSNGYLETKFKVFRRSDDTIVDETEAYIKIDSIVGIQLQKILKISAQIFLKKINFNQ